MHYRRLFLMMLFLLPWQSSLADATGAGDAALLSELMAQTKQLLEQVRELKEQVNITRRLEDMQQIKAVKAISTEGSAMVEVIRNLDSIADEVEDSRDNPLGAAAVERELDYFDRRVDSAQDAKDYARLAADLKRLKFLGQANEASMRNNSSGSNEADDNKSTATNTIIIANILVEQERRNRVRQAHEEAALKDMLRGSSYSSLYGGQSQ
ncbi:MAG: hypothetical protein GY814_13945 [Gammaproteobacteria bacterium]|nr:hypothetical protein [Gammaproteobacteria bacterium]